MGNRYLKYLKAVLSLILKGCINLNRSCSQLVQAPPRRLQQCRLPARMTHLHFSQACLQHLSLLLQCRLLRCQLQLALCCCALTALHSILTGACSSLTVLHSGLVCLQGLCLGPVGCFISCQLLAALRPVLLLLCQCVTLPVEVLLACCNGCRLQKSNRWHAGTQ